MNASSHHFTSGFSTADIPCVFLKFCVLCVSLGAGWWFAYVSVRILSWELHLLEIIRTHLNPASVAFTSAPDEVRMESGQGTCPPSRTHGAVTGPCLGAGVLAAVGKGGPTLAGAASKTWAAAELWDSLPPAGFPHLRSRSAIRLPHRL